MPHSTRAATIYHDELQLLKTELAHLARELDQSWLSIEPRLQHLSSPQRRSAANLIHYLALRSNDVRPLQQRLARCGLSSLGRAESHVMTSITAVLGLLRTITGEPAPALSLSQALTLDDGQEILRQRTVDLLGPDPSGRDVRIMVTLPSEAATDYPLVRALVDGGMDCARINCAHDDADAWLRMIRNIRRAERELKLHCRISMDVAGPKLRTGAVEAGPRVIRIRPKRDILGRLEKPAYVWLTADACDKQPATSLPCVPVPARFHDKISVGNKIKFDDTRGRKRSFSVDSFHEGRWLASCSKTAYIQTGTELRLAAVGKSRPAVARVGTLPPIEQYVLLRKGDHLVLTRDQTPGRPAKLDDDGRAIEWARLPCSLPEVFEDVNVGESVWFDDGRIGGVVAAASRDEIDIEITQAKVGGARLRADKGINLPDTSLKLPSLTEKDIADLAFIVKQADIVGYSFVRTASDVHALQDRLRALDGVHLGVILKIETRQAFDSLPDILLAAMRSRAAGVMIARGDLAIESGFERMAEIQEEIMWLCEAAHMPVIWATQVLEQLSKKGLPSRAEITDAAMSERAECVMLNKGPYVVDAVVALDDILTRMQEHQQKKRSMLRRLHLAEQFFGKHSSAGSSDQ